MESLICLCPFSNNFSTVIDQIDNDFITGVYVYRPLYHSQREGMEICYRVLATWWMSIMSKLLHRLERTFEAISAAFFATHNGDQYVKQSAMVPP